MKPTVITSGNSENPANHPDGSGMNSTGNPAHPANGGGAGNSTAYGSPRQFPQFQSGFGFDPYLDDIFSDPAIRSRLNRFRDPFAFARKRCGPNEGPESRFFDDDSDFFPSFGSFPTRRRAPSQGASGSGGNAASSGAPDPFYDHIPPEFRHYIPDDFGFSHSRGGPQPAPQAAPQAAPQPVHPQQYYEAYVQPPSPTYKQPPQQKAKLCDAAIQTEDFGDQDGEKEPKNLKQYGMRNTVDLGQKSPQEECRGSRSQSAPPPEGSDQNDSPAASKAQQTFPVGGASAQQTPDVQPKQQQTQTFNQQASKGTQPMTPPRPPPRGQQPSQQYQPWREQPQYQQHQQQPPHHETNTPQSGGGFTRTVPIFFEGRTEPTAKRTAPPRQSEQPQQQPQKPKPDHPTPLNVQQQPPPQSGNQAPPQTPHTTECINKIQGIQRDVLDLMGKVEQFGGIKNDKEYMFLDEMLTRNLLKLDTIDTNGKDNIRLARREAIKCIQASINVLEAKAEENAKTANSTVMTSQSETEGKQERAEPGEQKVIVAVEPINTPPENVAIPLPPPPEKETTTTIADAEANIENKPDIIKTNNVDDDIKKIEEQVETTKDTSEKIVEKPITENLTESKDNKENIENLETKCESTDEKKSENENVAEEIKTGEGVVKKKIIKKKKSGTDKKDKINSESVSPAEKSETQAENATATETPQQENNST